VAHRTVRYPGWRAQRTARSREFATLLRLYHRIIRCVTGLSGEPTEQRSTLPTVDCNQLCCSLKRQKVRDSLRCQVARTVWCATGLSGAPKGQTTSTVNSSKPQRSADVALTGQWTVECPLHHRIVRCTQRTDDFNGQQLQTPTVGWRGTHRTVNSGVSVAPPNYPVHPKDRWLQRSTTPNPNGRLTWHSPDSEQWSVCCTTELFGVLIDREFRQRLE
jgi:hypothetical protein